MRIGITTPIALPKLHPRVMSLPYFHERNFDIRKELRHSVWVESKTTLRGRTAASLEMPGTGGVLRGS